MIYAKADDARRSVARESSNGELPVRTTGCGDFFAPEQETVCLELEGIRALPRSSVTANGGAADWSYDESNAKLVVRLAEGTGETEGQLRL